MLTQKRLKELLHYDPESGRFTRLVFAGGEKTGSEAGWINSYGYRCINIDRTPYRANRLAFLYMTGAWPKGLSDHIDRNRLNNAWLNLRDATHAQNTANQSIRTDNTSGVRGVYWHKKAGKWLAQVQVNHRRVSLGLHSDLEFAELVAAEARAKYHE